MPLSSTCQWNLAWNSWRLSVRPNCGTGEERVFFSTYMFTPIYSSGFFAEDQYNVYIDSSISAPLLTAAPLPEQPQEKTEPDPDAIVCISPDKVDDTGVIGQLLAEKRKLDADYPPDRQVIIELVILGPEAHQPADQAPAVTTGHTLVHLSPPIENGAPREHFHLKFNNAERSYCVITKLSFLKFYPR